MVIEYGLKLLYNLCYRCESAHEALLICCQPQSFFATIHHHHSGDPGVMRHCRKLELTVTAEGWRGNVEEVITQEMKAAEIKTVDYYLDEKMSGMALEESDGALIAESKYDAKDEAEYDDDHKHYDNESKAVSKLDAEDDYYNDYK